MSDADCMVEEDHTEVMHGAALEEERGLTWCALINGQEIN